MISQEEIIAANKLTADDTDFRAEQRRIEMGVERMLKSPRSIKQTFIGEHDEQYEALQDIERENVEASRNQ